MAEEATTTTTSAAAEPAAEQKPVEIPQELIAQITKQATDAISAQVKELTANSKKEAMTEIVSRLTGEEEKSSFKANLLEKWVKDPDEVLSHVVQQAQTLAIEKVNELRKQDKEEEEIRRARNVEYANAAMAMLNERPDIKANAAIKEAVDRFYQETDPNLPEKERLDRAVKKADKFIEQIDGRSTEDRIKAAQSIPASGASNPAPNVDPEKVVQDYARSYIEQRDKDHLAKFGVLPPR